MIALLLTHLLASLFSLHAPIAKPYPYVATAVGYDISYPQCSKQVVLPASFSFGIVGVTGGKAFTKNPCFGFEYIWASEGGYEPVVYMNINEWAGNAMLYGFLGPLRCAHDYNVCRQYNFGWQAAKFAQQYARNVGIDPPLWWFDVETENSWEDDNLQLNQLALQGALDYFYNQNTLRKRKIMIGLYSTHHQWRTIMGDFVPIIPGQQSIPLWTVGRLTPKQAALSCTDKFGFAGGHVVLLQYTVSNIDMNLVCPTRRLSNDRPMQSPGKSR